MTVMSVKSNEGKRSQVMEEVTAVVVFICRSVDENDRWARTNIMSRNVLRTKDPNDPNYIYIFARSGFGSRISIRKKEGVQVLSYRWNHNVQYILSKCTQKGDRAMHHGINPSSLGLLQLNKYLLTLKSTSLKVQCQLVPEERSLVLWEKKITSLFSNLFLRIVNNNCLISSVTLW